MIPEPALEGLRILLVEDETFIAMMIEDQLIDLGCVVVGVAGSVAQGLDVIRKETAKLDGAVLDVNLGGEKVYPVAERLKEQGVPFIFSTGYGQAGITPQFAGTPTLAKPFGPEALRDLLISVVGRST